MDLRRDVPQDNFFARIEAPRFTVWYQGGNERYSWPVQNFIPYDFWHSMKHARNFFQALSALMLGAFFYDYRFRINAVRAVAFVLAGWMFFYSVSFTLFYWVIWR